METVTVCYRSFHASGCTRNGIFSIYRYSTSPTLEQCTQSLSTSRIKNSINYVYSTFRWKTENAILLTLQLHILQLWRRNWLDINCFEIGGVLVIASNSIRRLLWFRYLMELIQHYFDLVIGNPGSTPIQGSNGEYESLHGTLYAEFFRTTPNTVYKIYEVPCWFLLIAIARPLPRLYSRAPNRNKDYSAFLLWFRNESYSHSALTSFLKLRFELCLIEKMDWSWNSVWLLHFEEISYS